MCGSTLFSDFGYHRTLNILVLYSVFLILLLDLCTHSVLEQSYDQATGKRKMYQFKVDCHTTSHTLAPQALKGLEASI